MEGPGYLNVKFGDGLRVTAVITSCSKPQEIKWGLKLDYTKERRTSSMFGKLKKQKTKSPVEQMEQFYLNQFLNPPKPQQPGPNGMQQGGMGFNPMMGANNNSAGPQFSGRMVPPAGGMNSMINNGFNPGNPLTNANFNQPQPMMGNNFNPNQPTMGNGFNTSQPMMNNGFNPSQPTMNNGFNSSQPTMNNGFNPSQSTMNNGFNPSQPTMNNGFNASQPMMNGNFNQPQPMMNNENYPSMIPSSPLQNNFSPSTSLSSSPNDTFTPNIGAEPMHSNTFPGKSSFNDFSFEQLPAQPLEDLTPSLEDLTQTNILSNQYFQDTPLTMTPTETPNRIPGIPAPHPTPTPNEPLFDPVTPTQTITPPQTAQDLQSKVDNINIRLRKVESYLGFRPETTI